MMGFDDVFEVSAAAELVSEATREYLSENPDKLPAISTACLLWCGSSGSGFQT